MCVCVCVFTVIYGNPQRNSHNSAFPQQQPENTTHSHTHTHTHTHTHRFLGSVSFIHWFISAVSSGVCSCPVGSCFHIEKVECIILILILRTFSLFITSLSSIRYVCVYIIKIHKHTHLLHKQKCLFWS